MPTRRTSPRRAMTRPTVPLDDYDDDRRDRRVSVADRLADAAPAMALLALVAAIAALGVAFLGRGDDLANCRRSAWTALPSKDDLPDGWSLGSTDLNANGM